MDFDYAILADGVAPRPDGKMDIFGAGFDLTYPDGHGNTSLVGEAGGKTLRVVVAGDDPDFVITVIDRTT